MKYLSKIHTIIGICCLAKSTLNAKSFEWATATENLILDLGELYNKATVTIRKFGGELISTKEYKTVDKIDFGTNGGRGMYFLDA